MHLHFEKNINTKCDCSILSLSWMGKVPDDIPEDDGWKLNRTNYYQEGWLATGNIRGIVGVTFTTSHCKKNMDYPLRTNYNLRGHRSDVILVKWNEPYQKLASCDSSGIIFVWIKYEGRWSIELINDRNIRVTHFSWSHDGRMALICYQDGFVLVGSVAGQRYWSSMLNLESTITCGIWTPDDQQVYFGTTQGQVIVMDVHGAMVSQVQLSPDVGITSMSWSCEKFKMEEGEDTEPGVTNASKRSFVLAVSFQNGFIYLLKSFDDISPAHINTGLNGELGFVMEWSNSREVLAVAGTLQNTGTTVNNNGQLNFENFLKFFTENGNLLYTTRIPSNTTPVSALTWGHNDKRLFIATGTHVHIAWISKRVASLQLLCRLQIQNCIGSEILLPILPLPARMKSLISNLFSQTIRCCVPDSKSLREFVSRPPICSTRLHCTMIRHDDDSNLSSGTCYTLYLEYLGGLVPLLKGKRTSKIRPEFVIFDPQVDDISFFMTYLPESMKSGSESGSSNITINGRTDSSESDIEDKYRGSPKTPRKQKLQSKHKQYLNINETEITDELAYIDTLPEEIKLVEVTSNIWGTKFKIHGLAKTVPSNLGQVTYKTSLLHLQPRQMTLAITELRDDFTTEPDPNFNPNVFSEDEEDLINHNYEHKIQTRHCLNDNAPLIAPMSPRPNRFIAAASSRNTNTMTNLRTIETRALSPLARAESYDDDLLNDDDKKSLNIDGKNNRPKNIEPIPSTSTRPSPNYACIVTQYSRSSSNSSGQSRHVISPLRCEGSVPTLPTLQSPKNAVAPSDIIFDRPPATQTTLKNYTSNNDYTNCMSQINKNTLLNELQNNNCVHMNSNHSNLNLNLEKIDTTTSAAIIAPINIEFHDVRMIQTPADVPTNNTLSIQITRSCSAGFLEGIEMINSEVPFSILRNEAPNKRLVLVDKKPHKKRKHHQEFFRKPHLHQCGKSKSLDSWDIPTTIGSKSFSKDSENLVLTKKLNQIDESDTKIENLTFCTECNNNLDIKNCLGCQKLKLKCDNLEKNKINNLDDITSITVINKVQRNNLGLSKNSVQFEPIRGKQLSNRPLNDLRKKTEVIKSYTDSPLFTRKHRFNINSKNNSGHSSFNNNHEPNSNSFTSSTSEKYPSLLNNKNDSNFKLVKQLSEAKKRIKNGNLNNNNKDTKHDVTSAETKVSLHAQALSTLENIISRLRDMDENRVTPPSTPKKMPHSTPASPAPSKKGKRYQSSSPIRQILNSPLLNRRNRKKQIIESSDEEGQLTNGSGIEDNNFNSKQYKDLETFQKAQLRQKLKRGKIEPNGIASLSNPAPLRREFVMHNKAPMWNENSQVYQLDFGGRVTQESAKNFQIEFRGKQVMQFGRIDGNAYTLDFQYPFSALQAFAVALANVTQRLK